MMPLKPEENENWPWIKIYYGKPPKLVWFNTLNSEICDQKECPK